MDVQITQTWPQASVLINSNDQQNLPSSDEEAMPVTGDNSTHIFVFKAGLRRFCAAGNCVQLCTDNRAHAGNHLGNCQTRRRAFQRVDREAD